MIGYLTYKYIRFKTKTELTRKQLDQQIKSKIKVKDKENYVIVFSLIKDDFSKLLNATKRGKYIFCTPYWCINLCKDYPNICNAFNYTLGHELSHIYDFSYNKIKNKKFINWVNEVHADYMSYLFVKDSTYYDIKNAIIFKKNIKSSSDRNTKTHPSWEQRLAYIKQRKFDDKLIKIIARDTKCNDSVLIMKVSEHFDYIILK